MQGAISNPYASPEDRDAGRRLFDERCAVCHGPNGRGAVGPSLARSGYKNGDSDLSVYRVLTDGIVGTPMVPTNLSFAARWQVIGYLRNLQLRSSVGDNELHSLNIRVNGEQILKATERPGEWLSYSGSLGGWRFSSLSEITPANTAQLRLLWVHQFSTNETKFEFNPSRSRSYYFRQ